MSARAIVVCVALLLVGAANETLSAQDTTPPGDRFPVIGIGSGAGGRFGEAPGQARGPGEHERFAGRFADRKLMRADCRAGAERALERGLAWLAAQQEPDGSWKLTRERPSLAELQEPDGSWKVTGPPVALLRHPSVNDAGLTGLAFARPLGH